MKAPFLKFAPYMQAQSISRRERSGLSYLQLRFPGKLPPVPSPSQKWLQSGWIGVSAPEEARTARLSNQANSNLA